MNHFGAWSGKVGARGADVDDEAPIPAMSRWGETITGLLLSAWLAETLLDCTTAFEPPILPSEARLELPRFCLFPAGPGSLSSSVDFLFGAQVAKVDGGTDGVGTADAWVSRGLAGTDGSHPLAGGERDGDDDDS